ncbi:uncharacterized protein LOC135841009 [Planococcus citri]|uniref:uncharacterized protein LOC135841009 n=1 Tax=Planococcus citri TaxID=170843 RepID=UPI0031F76993
MNTYSQTLLRRMRINYISSRSTSYLYLGTYLVLLIHLSDEKSRKKPSTDFKFNDRSAAMNPMLICILLFTINTRRVYCAEETRNVSDSGPSSSTAGSPSQQTNSETNKAKESEIVSEEPQPQPTKPKPKGPFPALELIINGNKKFEARKPFYFCPAETPEQVATTRLEKFKFCLFEKEENKIKPDPKGIQCEHDPKPKLWGFSDDGVKCGKDDKGVLYTYIYEICWKSKSFYLKLPIIRSRDDLFPKIKRDFAEVYTVCWRSSDKETMYVRYPLKPVHADLPEPSTESQQKQPDDPQPSQSAVESHQIQSDDLDLQSTDEDLPENFLDYFKIVQLKTKGFINLDFQQEKEFFNTKKQSKILKEMFGDDFDEYLFPQMLVSSIHVNPEIAKTSVYNYLNVRPQWSSIYARWNKLEEHIRAVKLKSTRYLYVYSGTNGTLIRNEKELNLKFGKSITLSVPAVWWKLIMDDEYQEGIVLAMQNEPKKFPNLGELLCTESICNSQGWEEIDGIAYCCKFDDTMRTKLGLDKEDILITEVFNPQVPVGSRPKPKPRPKPKKNRVRLFKDWLKKTFKSNSLY